MQVMSPPAERLLESGLSSGDWAGHAAHDDLTQACPLQRLQLMQKLMRTLENDDLVIAHATSLGQPKPHATRRDCQ